MRDGYNTNWLWKMWQRECTAAREAIARGDYESAERLLDAAEETSRQIALGDVGRPVELDDFLS